MVMRPRYSRQFPARELTRSRRSATFAPWGSRSPHEATRLSIASNTHLRALSRGHIMSSLNAISIDKLARLIGRPDCPTLIDVQIDEDFAADPRLVPGSVRRSFKTVSDWAPQ